jgi:deoxyribonuclease V
MDHWVCPADLEEAKKAQLEMAEKICLEDDFGVIRLIGGMDVSNNLYDPSRMIYSACVTLQSSVMRELAHAQNKALFPYIPGYLGFREAPALIEAFKQLKGKPDLLFVDGHGISHPRGVGIASQVGVILNIPAIGVAKSILVGTPEGILSERAGSHIPLVWKGREIARVVRTKRGAKPLIISAGHRITLQTAVGIVLEASKGYRLPEPTRQAHLAANKYRKDQISKSSSFSSSLTAMREEG